MQRFPGPGGAGRRPFGPGPGPNGGAGQGDDFRGAGPDGDFPGRPPFRRDQRSPRPGPGTNSAFGPDDRGRPDFPDRPPRPDGPDFQRGPPNFGPDGQPLLPGNRERPTVFHAAVLKARTNIPIYWVVVCIVHALTYYRRSQDRERKALELEARLTDAKLEALRMQLQPHFLFNTLNAISTLVHRDPHAADEMIANLEDTPAGEFTVADAGSIAIFKPHSTFSV
jgi:hypothetical protein